MSTFASNATRVIHASKGATWKVNVEGARAAVMAMGSAAAAWTAPVERWAAMRCDAERLGVLASRPNDVWNADASLRTSAHVSVGTSVNVSVGMGASVSVVAGAGVSMGGHASVSVSAGGNARSFVKGVAPQGVVGATRSSGPSAAGQGSLNLRVIVARGRASTRSGSACALETGETTCWVRSPRAFGQVTLTSVLVISTSLD